MGRVYKVPFDDVSIAAIQELFSITTPAGMAISIHEITLAQRTLTAWEAKPLRAIRASGTFTASATGATVVPKPVNFGDSASACTVRTNDTTLALVNTGVFATVLTDDWLALNNYLYLPAPEDRIILPPSQCFLFRFPVVWSGSTNASGTLTYEEIC